MKIRELTDDEIGNYRRDGYCYVPQLVDDKTVSRLLKAVDQRKNNPGEHGVELAAQGSFFQEQYIFPEVPVFREFMTSVDMARNAARAMGSKIIRAYFDHIFVCEPDTPVDYYWHQDLAYWPADGRQICSFWLSLTDCDRKSAALQFVKGTGNREDLFAQVPFGENDNQDGRYGDLSAREAPPQFEDFPDKYELVTWEFSAGDAVLFNARVVHSSGGNSSKDMRRVAYSSRWIGDDVVFKKRGGVQDPCLFPDEDEDIREGDYLTSRRFPLVYSE